MDVILSTIQHDKYYCVTLIPPMSYYIINKLRIIPHYLRRFKMVNFCMRGAAKAIGLSILAFCIGIMIGLFCPLPVLAVIEMVLLTVFGYLCLFRW